MAFNPASILLELWLWFTQRIIAVLEPIRVSYDETTLQFIYVRWAEVTGYLVGIVLLLFVGAVASGSWAFVLVVLFFGFGLVGLITLALRRIRSTVTANKPNAWIKVVHIGLLGDETLNVDVRSLRSITYEPVRMKRGMYDVSVMTSEGTVVIFHDEGIDLASELVSYLNGFFFEGDADDVVWEEGHEPPTTASDTKAH